MKSVLVFTIGDVIGVALISIAVFVAALLGLRSSIKRAFCKHKNYYEPTVYHGYKCTECGKDFGYTRPRT